MQHDFLQSLALVLCVAAVTTLVFQRLRQPVVLGYILAGLIIGPHVPIPLVADTSVVTAMSELGVILLMFALGLEFRLKKLVQVGPTAGITAVVQASVMLWLGFIVGRLFGWTPVESFFCGSIIAISSTTIIAKAFDEQRIGGRLRELVVGILIVEDLIAILLMATLTAVASGSGLSTGELAFTVGRLVAFLVGTLVVGMLVVPRAMRAIVKFGRPETIVIASIGICFAVSLLALEIGYSVALGAFVAGSLVAESGEAHRIESLTQPVKDIFAAIFFVSVGMLIDPQLVAEYWLPILVLTLVVIIGKIVTVAFGAFLTGAGTRTAVQSGMSLAQIGEFSFIIAALGISLNATRPFLYPVAVAVSAVTTLTTPYLIRASGPAASFVDSKLPRSMQTFAALYGRWIERVKAPSRVQVPAHQRLLRLLVLDAALLSGVIIGVAVFGDHLGPELEERFGMGARTSSLLVVAAGVALASPLVIGIARVARRLGVVLARRALPLGEDGRVDLAAAPRRALVVALQLAIVLLVGAPIVAVTQPFLEGFAGAALFALLLGALAVVFWRRAAHLQGHVRAGAEVIVRALAARGAASRDLEPDAAAHAAVLQQIAPGLGEPITVELTADSPAAGASLHDLDLRGRTGASVLVILRNGEGFVPEPDAPLRAGDLLALAGAREAIDAARAMLLGTPAHAH